MPFQKLGSATGRQPIIHHPLEPASTPLLVTTHIGLANGITTAQAAEILGLKPKTLANWRCKGRGPAFMKYGDAKNAPVRYDPVEVARYRDQHRRRSTSDRGGKRQ